MCPLSLASMHYIQLKWHTVGWGVEHFYFRSVVQKLHDDLGYDKKLEQAIVLTFEKIDHDFARVKSETLPILEIVIGCLGVVYSKHCLKLYRSVRVMPQSLHHKVVASSSSCGTGFIHGWTTTNIPSFDCRVCIWRWLGDDLINTELKIWDWFYASVSRQYWKNRGGVEHYLPKFDRGFPFKLWLLSRLF